MEGTASSDSSSPLSSTPSPPPPHLPSAAAVAAAAGGAASSHPLWLRWVSVFVVVLLMSSALSVDSTVLVLRGAGSLLPLHNAASSGGFGGIGVGGGSGGGLASGGVAELMEGRLSDEYLHRCNGECGARARCFLGKCFCLPGWAPTGDRADGGGQGGRVDCTKRRLHRSVDEELCPVYESLDAVTHAAVEPYPEHESRCLADSTVHSPLGCAVLCFWQEGAGIVQVSKTVWQNVSNKEFAMWKHGEKDLPDDRDGEHAEGFANFQSAPLKLGRLLEIGAGPYTQTKNLLRCRPDAEVDHIYLAEPNIFRYLTLKNCPYKFGKLMGRPVNLLSLPVEELPADEYFDTVLQINVIEHVYNALDFLTAVYKALRPGGLLIFHERFYVDAEGGDSRVLGSLLLHPVRPEESVYLHLFRLFDPVFVRPLPTKESLSRNFGERGYYFMGIKRAFPLPENEPDMEEFRSQFGGRGR